MRPPQARTHSTTATERLPRAAGRALAARAQLTGLALATVALALVLASLIAPSPAQADLEIGSVGSGAGQHAGLREGAQSLAIDPSNGHLYVADGGNNRVDVFDSSGAFVMAFGWGVKSGDTATTGLDVCTTVTGCQAGFAGGGPGQLTRPNGIAVDGGSHDIYVTEGGPSSSETNHRVQKFDASGNFLAAFGKEVNTGSSGNTELCTAAGPPTDVCAGGSAGSDLGQFNEIKGIGVTSAGTVYVADSRNAGACPGGSFTETEFVNRVEQFDPTGEAIEQAVLTDAPLCVRLKKLFAVSSSGVFYVAFEGNDILADDFIRKYDSSGSPLATLSPRSPNFDALAVDASGDLFVSGVGVGHNGPRFITEYDSTGIPLRAIYSDVERGNLGSLAPYGSATGDIFVAEDTSFSPGNIFYAAFPPPGPYIRPASVVAAGIGSAKATLEAEINPEGEASSYRVEYVDDATYRTDIEADGPGHGFDHAKSTESTTLGAADFELHPTQPVVAGCPDPASETELPGNDCLTPSTLYHFRVVASSDAGNGKGPIEGAAFETEPPLRFGASFATEVGDDTARVNAEVNPLGAPTNGRFEYIEDSVFREDVSAAEADPQDVAKAEAECLGDGSGEAECVEGKIREHGFDRSKLAPEDAELDFGASEGEVTRSVQLGSLPPATTYHYRLIAANPLTEPLTGPEGTFTTLRATRANEACPNDAFRTGPAALLPDCRAYEMVSPVDKGNSDIATLYTLTGFVTGHEQSAASGERLAYSSATAFGGALSAPYVSQYLAHRIPGVGWESHSISPPRDGNSIIHSIDDQFKEFSLELGSGWLLADSEPTLAPDAIPGFAGLYRHDNDSGSYEALCPVRPQLLEAQVFKPQLQGVSEDGVETIFRVKDKLTEEASGKEGVFQLYGCVAGALRLLSVLPNGSAAIGGASAGTASSQSGESADRESSFAGAVSVDGSRVFWTAANAEAGPLYVRVNAEQPPSETPGCEPGRACTIQISSTAAQFWGAAADGSVAVFTSGGKLFSFDVDKAEAGEEAKIQIAGEAVGVLGMSKDASHIYFVSREALTGEEENSEGDKAQAGEPNLFLYEEGREGVAGSFSFIATLSQKDARTSTGDSVGAPVTSPINFSPFRRSSRVTPDGLQAAFASSASLTGYENTDANSGEPDLEVFVYNASTKRLACASCNPSGARPIGTNIAVGEEELWAAAEIPGWQDAMYGSRILSEDGKRLFFQSTDPLTLGDTNGKQDVYEWEVPGSGDCSETSASYSPTNGGCLSLISSGESPSDSEFVDASANGTDAFFKTSSSLVPQDPGLVDIYDARADGGCLPEPGLPAACEGEACQGPLTPPNDATPASSAFEGAGNVVEKPAKKVPAKKTHRKKHRKSKKHHHRKSKRHHKGKKNHKRTHVKRANTNRRGGR